MLCPPYCGFSHCNVLPASVFRIIWEDLEDFGGGTTIIGMLFMKKPFQLKNNKEKKSKTKRITCLSCLPKSGAPCYLGVFEHSKWPFCHILMLVFTLLSPDKKQFKREMIYCVSWLEKNLQSSWWQEHISGTPHLLIDRAGQTGGQQARLDGTQVFILGQLFPPAWSGCSNRWRGRGTSIHIKIIALFQSAIFWSSKIHTNNPCRSLTLQILKHVCCWVLTWTPNSSWSHPVSRCLQFPSPFSVSWPCLLSASHQ